MTMRTTMRTLGALLPLCALLLAPAPAPAQTLVQVADLNTDGAVRQEQLVGPFVKVGEKVFFYSYDRATLDAVWVSDGTAAGTEMLADPCPGPCGYTPEMLGGARGLAFWLSTQVPQSTDKVLWRSDGTRRGTFALTDPAVVKAYKTEGSTSPPVVRGLVFFEGCTTEQGCQLWKSDGTPEGTALLTEAGYPSDLTVVGDRLFFLATDLASHQTSLWKTDGTAAGTTLVKALGDISQGFSGSLRLTAAGNRLFFLLRSPEQGEDLWVSDGTAAGTRPVTQFAPQSPFYLWPRAIGDRVYFIADDGTNGLEIWRSDGTAAGTVRVTDLADPQAFSELGVLQEVGDRVVYLAQDHSHPRLWATGGSPATTVELCPGCQVEGTPLLKAGDRIVFVAQDATHGRELWTTDGTTQGTRMIRDLCPGDCDGTADPFWFEELGGVAFFYGPDGQLWVSDGTTAGTRTYTDMPGGFRAGFYGTSLVFVGTKLFVSAVSPQYGLTLWTSDGRPGGTRVVTELVHGAPESNPDHLVALGDRILFTACDGRSTDLWANDHPQGPPVRLTTHPEASSCGGLPAAGITRLGGRVFFWDSPGSEDELWSSDGTVAGTRQVATFPPYRVRFQEIHDFQGQALFVKPPESSAEPDPIEIWTSDGTPAGTRKAFDLPAEIRRISALHVVGNELYFAVVRAGEENQIWRSDGTAAGTRKILTGDFEEWFEVARLGEAVLLLTSRTADTGGSLWRTDGTAAGTVLLRSFELPYYLSPADLTIFQGAAWFFAAASPQTRALWRTDGTAAGTTVVREVGWNPAELTVAGGRLFFAGIEGPYDSELWQSDGTAAGTTRVRDILPGPQGSRPHGLQAAGGRLFFVADDGLHGSELWVSDGTAAGTRLVQDLAPGLLPSDPAGLVEAGGALYLSADDGDTGRELWALPLAAGAACEPAADHLCLEGGRFRVEARWRDFQGHTGRGTAVGLTGDSGYFWFFGPDNVEVVVKVLDGEGVNGHHWVFYGALSSVEYALTVTDTRTGATARYFNPMGQLASVGDTQGFGPLGALASASVRRVTAPALRAMAQVAERVDPKAATGACQAGPARLCLNGGRFAVEASWKAHGQSGAGKAVALTGDTGYFWFFGSDNIEVMLKVLDGTTLNGKFWVFYGALSDVEYTLTVTDTQTGKVRTYANPAGRMASVADTGAF